MSDEALVAMLDCPHCQRIADSPLGEDEPLYAAKQRLRLRLAESCQKFACPQIARMGAKPSPMAREA